MRRRRHSRSNLTGTTPTRPCRRDSRPDGGHDPIPLPPGRDPATRRSTSASADVQDRRGPARASTLTRGAAAGSGPTAATIAGRAPERQAHHGPVRVRHGQRHYTQQTGTLDDDAPSQVSAEIAGLSPATTYFYVPLRAATPPASRPPPSGPFTTLSATSPARANRTRSRVARPAPPALRPAPPPPSAPSRSRLRVAAALQAHQDREDHCGPGASTAAEGESLRIIRAAGHARGTASRLTKGRLVRR
jgi:hypothetical protein